MTVWIGLLRAVNVGGNMLKMERLRALAAELGFQRVRTYVQSGNLLFEAPGTEEAIRKKLEAKLTGETRLPPIVLLRSAAELAAIAAGNPFLAADSGVDRKKLHVTFLTAPPAAAAFEKLSDIVAGSDELRLAGRELYLHCPGGYGESKLSNVRLEKSLALPATTRNWNTVTKLLEMANG